MTRDASIRLENKRGEEERRERGKREGREREERGDKGEKEECRTGGAISVQKGEVNKWLPVDYTSKAGKIVHQDKPRSYLPQIIAVRDKIGCEDEDCRQRC